MTLREEILKNSGILTEECLNEYISPAGFAGIVIGVNLACKIVGTILDKRRKHKHDIDEAVKKIHEISKNGKVTLGNLLEIFNDDPYVEREILKRCDFVNTENKDGKKYFDIKWKE